ncbi:MAG TPA: flagellar hook protein FlgE [Haliea salexigens]|uniref:Flagellar hook protein FlgE n=1 Tax=Haliea salexigens TaxID=287487 RepID=A0A3C1KLR0_9GAMM|nr:flagellar hook protein FlgE [Haliea salexigens]HBX72986.1 flagellar hook protein FlgE [Halieaceae bacterium]|tara:strand:+ start:1331 stop:2596 length:1266 start_codon:yes stop_codon:yes gene_type:complete
MAFDTAISGINAASADLNVISNNIANASTVGYKTSRAEFADVFATSLLGAGGNAIGKGVSLSAVTQEFGQGNISFTDNALDLAISGGGFYQLSVDGALQYTRAGNFKVDREGFVVSNAGSRLQGFQVNAAGDVTGQLGDIQIDTSLLDPNPTGLVDLTSNLDSREVPPTVPFGGPFDAFAAPPTAPDPSSFNATTSTTVYDGLGNPHVLSLYFVKTATPNEWEVHSLVDGVTTSGPDTLTFQSNGQFDPLTLPVEVSITGWQPLNAAGVGTGADPQDITVSLSDTTQFGTPFAVSSVVQDGFSAGQLRGLEIDSTGIAFARFTNGESRALAQIALANFNNPNGLQPIGDTNWVETFASGPSNVGAPGTSGLGVIQSAALEESNVEITAQLVDLIIAQRNFQANAQVIQAEDAVTQTVINLR